jgi:hypothetical protein
MKKILYSIAITIFLSANLHAQTPDTGKWMLVPNPAGLLIGYDEMVFVTDTIGYIYGSTTNSLNDMERTADSGVDFTELSFQLTPTLRSPNFVSNMAWPTAENGYIAADTGSVNTPSLFFLSTANGGASWTASSIGSFLQLGSIFFPSANVGYGTGILSDGSGTNFIAKTTNAGATWDSIYGTIAYTLEGLYFIDANNGMLLAQNEGTNQVNIAYTTNGGASFTYRPLPTTSQPYFLYWNKEDSSWLVGADSVYRSVDSGQHWTCVIANDSVATAGAAVVGAFYGDTGFVFLATNPIVFMTTDAGVSWTSSRLPNNGSSADSVNPIAASMPSQYVCYLLANDNNATDEVMMKIAFAKPTSGGGGNGVVQENPVQAAPFAVMIENNAAVLTMAPAVESRNFEVMDILGRECAYGSVAPNATQFVVPLKTGTYFATLDGSVVKFVIP